ncbi:MAG: DUF2461 domain-containing protein [Anaerolineaceae bacterium]|nr:DUF2461 domain-containing protein [Anaerolineaceae bacterium]
MQPPFSGFPQAGLDFLAQLAANNEWAWFEAHKDDYQKLLLEPAQAFVVNLGAKLEGLVDGLYSDPRTDGRGVLMRIHRDTRFSKDKSPYKTNISGIFWAGERKKMESSAFGFQIEADGMGLMAGMFSFTPAMLTAYRAAVDDDRQGGKLADIAAALQHTGVYTLNGEHFKRVPTGYAADHPRADLLRHNGLYVFSPRIPVSDILSPALVDICYAHFEKMAPVQRWLAAVAT